MGKLLEVQNLQTSFFTPAGEVKAVNGISFCLTLGETLGLVGESGCGKSVTALSIMQLLPKPQGKVIDGKILFERQNLLDLSEKQLCQIRGDKMAMIFQEPMTSLNPVYTVGNQIAEAVQLHMGLSKKDSWERAAEMLKLVGIPSPGERLRDYPHQMSGGMRQRVMIAMALSCHPQLLIADEPTTALDVTIQAQILDLLKRLKEEIGMSILLITHDLGVIADIAQRAAVMYAGRIVEIAPTREIFYGPRHPYTKGLLKSIPRLNTGSKASKSRLSAIPGSVPSLLDLPTGCSFQDRCTDKVEICTRQKPVLKTVGEDHWVSCWRGIQG
ncbi:MAG: ABC transporter ATP-binding protein [Candidatus Schekmanbacteria bacterium]|nr:ABC transporter ATP-binding protein [Candidatus Schekmanbacteria bacterium]